MSSMLIYLPTHITNIYSVVKALHERSENLDMDLADVLEWLKDKPELSNDLRSTLTRAEEGAFKAVANLEAILTATTLTPDTRGYTHAKIE